MVRVGKPPYLECSTKGDQRFSAFCAKPASLNGKTIEEAYQAMKILRDGTTGHTIAEAKGKYAQNMPDCVRAYKGWWKEWVEQEHLLPVLQAASGLSDVFGQKGHVCQAIALWEIRNSDADALNDTTESTQYSK